MSPPTPWHSLRRHRLKASLTIAELARLAKMSESGVQHLEAGRRKPRPQTVLRLAAALKVKPDELRADLVDSTAAELDSLREQAAVLGERIEQIAAALPAPRTKTTQEVA